MVLITCTLQKLFRVTPDLAPARSSHLRLLRASARYTTCHSTSVAMHFALDAAIGQAWVSVYSIQAAQRSTADVERERASRQSSAEYLSRTNGVSCLFSTANELACMEKRKERSSRVCQHLLLWTLRISAALC